MAYKPTREQRFGVTPVGITQATGLRSMANAFANVGKSVRQVSQAKRETDFSNAMLDAELAGISAVTRDKDGNLQPLNNLDWDSGLDYTVDRNKAFDVFKRVATNTYSTALKVDTEKFSSAVFAENIMNPKAINQAGESYLNKLEQELPPEVFQKVLPSVQTSFLNKENTAKANLITYNKKEALENAKNHLKNTTTEIANLLASKAITDTPFPDMWNERLKELKLDQENLRDDFKFGGLTDSEVDDLFNSQEQFIQSRVSNEYIKNFFEKSDYNYISSLQEIQKVKETFADNPNINIEQIEQGMKQSLSESYRIQTAIETRKNKLQSNAYSDALLAVRLKEITTAEQVLSLEDKDGDPLNNNYKAALLSYFEGSDDKELLKTQAKIWKNNTAALLSDFEVNYDGLSTDKKHKLMADIKKAIEVGITQTNNGVPNYDWSGFNDKFIKIQQKHWEIAKKLNISEYMTLVESEMHESANYARDPGYFRTLTKELIDDGIIGESSTAYMKINAWNKKVNDYEMKFNENKRRINIEKMAIKKAKVGDVNNFRHIMEVRDYNSQVELNGELVDIDPLSENKQIRDASIEEIIRFSVKYNTVHPSIRSLLQNFTSLDDEFAYRTTLSVYKQIMEGFKKKKGLLRYDQGYHRGIMFMQGNGVETGFLEMAQFIPYEKAQELFSSANAIDANRTRNKIVPKGQDRTEFWKNVFNEAINEETWKSWIVGGLSAGLIELDDVSETARAQLNQFRKQNGVDLAGAVLDKNPQLLNLMISMAESKVAYGKVANSDLGHKQAVVSVMGDLGNNIGFAKSEDGEVYLTLHPYMVEFQNYGNVPEGMEITEDSVFTNIRDVFNNLHDAEGVIWDNETRKLFEEGNFYLVPNETYGEQIDYKVFVRDEYDNQVLLLDNYRYNYFTSRDFDAYKQTMKEFKSKTLKKIWAAIPGMDDVLFGSQIKKWQETYNTKGVVADILETYNIIGRTLGGYDFKELSPDDIEATDDDWQLFFEKIKTLGIK